MKGVLNLYGCVAEVDKSNSTFEVKSKNNSIIHS